MAQQAAAPLAQRYRVLIIDANNERRQLLRETVQAWGFDAVSAYDGYSGMRHIMNDRPDIIIVDADLKGWPSSTVIDGATRLGSRAMIVMLNEQPPSATSRLSRRRIVGVVDDGNAIDDLRLLLTAAVEKLGRGRGDGSESF